MHGNITIVGFYSAFSHVIEAPTHFLDQQPNGAVQQQRIGYRTAKANAKRQSHQPTTKGIPMSSRVDGIQLAAFLPIIQHAEKASVDHYREIFEGNRHRVYSLSYYMTDNELTAEEVMTDTFCRAFAASRKPDAETIDRALVTELREITPIGSLTVQCQPATQVSEVRRSTRRADLERAVVQLPATERLESAASFKALFTHRVRVNTINDVDAQVVAWLKQAYDLAG